MGRRRAAQWFAAAADPRPFLALRWSQDVHQYLTDSVDGVALGVLGKRLPAPELDGSLRRPQQNAGHDDQFKDARGRHVASGMGETLDAITIHRCHTWNLTVVTVQSEHPRAAAR